MEPPEFPEDYTAENFESVMSQFRKYLAHACIATVLRDNNSVSFDAAIGWTRYEGTNYWGVNPILGDNIISSQTDVAGSADIFEYKWRYFDDSSLAKINGALREFEAYELLLKGEMFSDAMKRDVDHLIERTSEENWEEDAAYNFRSSVSDRIEHVCNVNGMIAIAIKEALAAYSELIHVARSAVYHLLKYTINALYLIGEDVQASGEETKEDIEVISEVTADIFGSDNNEAAPKNLFTEAFEAISIRLNNEDFSVSMNIDTPASLFDQTEAELDQLIEVHDAGLTEISASMKSFQEGFLQVISNDPFLPSVSDVYGD